MPTSEKIFVLLEKVSKIKYSARGYNLAKKKLCSNNAIETLLAIISMITLKQLTKHYD